MKKALALLFAVAPLLAQGPIAWEHSLAAGLKRAKAENKPVFLDIWAEWCPPCQHLRKNVFPTPTAERALEGYVPVSLMVEKANRETINAAIKEAERFKVEAFPTLVILDSNGKELRRKVGAFPTAVEFANWLSSK
jgi:thioredoxin 1